MEGILLKGISIEITKDSDTSTGDREVGNSINDSIVYYKCGSLVHRRKGGCADCLATLVGSHCLPVDVTIEYLVSCKNKGNLEISSKQFYCIMSKVEASFLTSVKENRIFFRDSFEAILHDLTMEK